MRGPQLCGCPPQGSAGEMGEAKRGTIRRLSGLRLVRRRRKRLLAAFTSKRHRIQPAQRCRSVNALAARAGPGSVGGRCVLLVLPPCFIGLRKTNG